MNLTLDKTAEILIPQQTTEFLWRTNLTLLLRAQDKRAVVGDVTSQWHHCTHFHYVHYSTTMLGKRRGSLTMFHLVRYWIGDTYFWCPPWIRGDAGLKMCMKHWHFRFCRFLWSKNTYLKHCLLSCDNIVFYQNQPYWPSMWVPIRNLTMFFCSLNDLIL